MDFNKIDRHIGMKHMINKKNSKRKRFPKFLEGSSILRFPSPNRFLCLSCPLDQNATIQTHFGPHDNVSLPGRAGLFDPGIRGFIPRIKEHFINIYHLSYVLLILNCTSLYTFSIFDILVGGYKSSIYKNIISKS